MNGYKMKLMRATLRTICIFWVLLALAQCTAFYRMLMPDVGKVRLLDADNDTKTHPFASPESIQFTASGPPLYDLEGTWLIQSAQGVLQVTGILEFKPSGPGQYQFITDTLFRTRHGNTDVETKITSTGHAQVQGDQVILFAENIQVNTKSDSSLSLVDTAGYYRDLSTDMHAGRNIFRILNQPNRLQLIQSITLMTTQSERAGKSENSVNVLVTAHEKPDMLKVTNETISHILQPPAVNPSWYGDYRSKMVAEMPDELQTYYQSTGPALKAESPKAPRIKFSGMVFQVRKTHGKIVIYSSTQLTKLHAGKTLEIRSRKTQQKNGTVSVDVVNHTNAIASLTSGNIDQIDVSDAVIGY